MCGIVGWFDCRSSNSIQDDPTTVLNEMRDSLVHRGPDDFGSWIGNEGHVALGNRRLSIVDLSERGKQPMASETSDLVLSYNGEVYNHLDLRTQLESLGHRFRSNCDTETVLYSFQQWGIGCLSRLKGQYAFAIWDGRSKTVYLARDKVGLQPLYFYSKDGLIVFGSELRSILMHPNVKARINYNGLYQYFVMHSPAPPFTMLEDIYVVPAGSFVACSTNATPKLERYWSVLDEVGSEDLSGIGEEDLAERIRTTLMESVRRRLMSDRPVGMFLSGGVDSTSILACLSTMGTTNLRSYSIGYSNQTTHDKKDEFSFAKQAADTFQSPHTMLRTQPNRLREFLDTCDLPPENLAEFWLWEMAEAASQDGVPVMMHGEGADELFFGYDFHWNVLSERKRIYDNPNTNLSDISFDSGIPPGTQLLPLGQKNREDISDLMFWGGGVHPKFEYQRDNYFDLNHGFNPDKNTPGLDTSQYRPMSNKTEVLDFIRSCYETSQQSNEPSDYRNRMQYLEFIHKLPEVLLRRSEPSCMKHSVEIRLPFLDEDMVSLAVNLPLNSLRTPQLVKYPLRLAMKGLVPERIRARPKEFFGVSFSEASQQWPSKYPWFQDYLFESKFATLGVISKNYLKTQYDHLTKDGDGVGFETFLWKHVFTAIWYDKFVSAKP